MQTYGCTCGNRLFFENTRCVVCQSEVGWCESCHRITALEPGDSDGAGGHDYRCSYSDCRAALRKCHNYAVQNVCNRLYPIGGEARAAIRHAAPGSAATPAAPAPPASAPPAVVSSPAPSDSPGPTSAPAAASAHDAASAPEAPVSQPPEPTPAEQLCSACQLNDTIPDLSVPGHREKWARLEAAKRRLLYSLDRLALPYLEATPRLSFDFKADVEPPANDWRNAGPTEVVYTGHANGKITINIREADDAERERLRVQFHEAHRTLIGHFHHEIGHYYWQLLVDGRPKVLRQFVNLFGDHNKPSYADAMAAYYQNGPRPQWAESYLSAYASSHPWEDFAETFALYLDIVAVLDTASHLFKSVKANFRSRSVAPLIQRFQEIGILENEFNRSMGLIDLVPEVVATPVVAKLQFIHDLVRNAGTKRREKHSMPVEANPMPVLMQQGSPACYEPVRYEPVRYQAAPVLRKAALASPRRSMGTGRLSELHEPVDQRETAHV